MSRDIKFKFWCEETRRMSEAFTLNELILIDDGENYSCINEKFALQYTGLKDKDGKEIYDGDIVEIKIGYCKNPNIHMETKKCKVEYVAITGYCVGYECLGAYDIYSAEVVGNIYENGDLLK